jgi:Phage endonuclease I
MTTKKRRSRLEDKVDNILTTLGVPYEYEVTKLAYTVPESHHTYTVDWTVVNNKLWESKGYLSDYSERRKYILIKEQHPDLDLRFIFDNPNKLCGGTKMTHAAWANKYGFKWCGIKDVDTIKEWVNE